ncbi:hypothetical protein [Chryseobacterium nematophagum]|uniref:hypothetical protein n=1 Tax=Chryseobacterium nematophagum TaxID=2305228 RepID=UPI001604BB4F|nr:hypothetical protein [Chryseobacterium nematophagum]
MEKKSASYTQKPVKIIDESLKGIVLPESIKEKLIKSLDSVRKNNTGMSWIATFKKD